MLIETAIEDADGKVVASTSGGSVGDLASTGRRASTNSAASAAAGAPVDLTAKVAVTSATLRIPQPHLWQGMKDPYLYRTVVTLRSPTGEILDRVTQPLGLRTLAFDPDKGFFLNGEHLSLHGASMHQDRPGRVGPFRAPTRNRTSRSSPTWVPTP